MYGRHFRRAIGSAPGLRLASDSSCAHTRHLHVTSALYRDDKPPLKPTPSRGISRRSASVDASKEIQNLASKPDRSGQRTVHDNPQVVVRRQLSKSPVQQPIEGDLRTKRRVSNFLFGRNESRTLVRSSKYARGSSTRGLEDDRDSRREAFSSRRHDNSDRSYDESEEDELALARDESVDQDEDEGQEFDDLFASAFENEEEMVIYARLQDSLEELYAMTDKVSDLLENDTKEAETEATELCERIHIGVTNCLEELAEVKRKWSNPQHIPQDLERVQAVGNIGDVPIGSGGMGRVTEESLRVVIRRQNMEWQKHTKLAKRLADGALMKFRDNFERDQVAVFSTSETSDEENPEVDPYMFVPLEHTSRKAIVQRLVRGEYTDTGDEALKDEVLQNVARITNGNFTYLAEEKSKLLEKIQTLLPVPMTVE